MMGREVKRTGHSHGCRPYFPSSLIRGCGVFQVQGKTFQTFVDSCIYMSREYLVSDRNIKKCSRRPDEGKKPQSNFKIVAALTRYHAPTLSRRRTRETTRMWLSFLPPDKTHRSSYRFCPSHASSSKIRSHNLHASHSPYTNVRLQTAHYLGQNLTCNLSFKCTTSNCQGRE